MKKYRLKDCEPIKKEWRNKIVTAVEFLELTKSEVCEDGFPINFFIEKGLVEEVEERIELELDIDESSGTCYICYSDGTDMNETEKDLCEKALNGELLDIDSLDDDDFEDWYTGTVSSICGYSTVGIKGIKEVLKQYLKEKK